MSLNNNISSLSYTNKDFNSIYTELLEYAKKLSYKWDPTASDESDPGVVLLKLAAIIGDKDNYNIDKNVLELMPASVTQLPAARQIFDQCGYSMRYYRAAEGSLSLYVKKHPSKAATQEQSNEGTTDTEVSYNYLVPMFTMFSDADSSVVYTSVRSTVLSHDVLKTSVDVMEGVAVEYSINSDPLITLANLDTRNRLYFTDMSVAENGIFICNDGESNYDDWYRTDNLQLEPRLSPCYKFGVTLDGTMCYIEFPDDIGQCIGSGIRITYIRTNGNSGNVAARKITQFFSGAKFKRVDASLTKVLQGWEEAEEVDVTTENISITNDLPITTGADPESIAEGYRNYQRVKTTFDTLVTVKDYTDYMITSKCASNGYVCDRTNDVQHSYKILEMSDLGTINKTYVESDGVQGTAGSTSVPAMSAYDLCAYPLSLPTFELSTPEGYNETFNLISSANFETTLEDPPRQFGIKSLQHDFISYTPEKILMIKNKYDIRAYIIPRNKLSVVEQYEVRSAIISALCKALNSQKLTFGEEVSYDLILQTVTQADPRIRAASVEYPRFQTYVVYVEDEKTDDNTFREVRVDKDYDISALDESQQKLIRKFRSEILAKNILAGVTPLYVPADNFLRGVTQTDPCVYKDIKSVSTNTCITLKKNNNNRYVQEQPLEDNESLLLTTPNVIQESSYSTYVKVVHNLTNTVLANQEYSLKDDEYIVFFWKSADANTYYDYMKYTNEDGSPAKIIKPTFNLEPQDQNARPDFVDNLRVGSGKTWPEHYNDIAALTDSKYVLQGLNTIYTYNINSVTIPDQDKNCRYVFFISSSSSGKPGSSTLEWTESKNIYVYTLKPQEYLLYTNANKTSVEILGQGTSLELHTSQFDSDSWEFKKLTYNELMQGGIDAVPEWHTLKTNESLIITEMRQILLGPGAHIELSNYELTDGSKETIEVETTVPLKVGENVQIDYTLDGGTTTSLEKAVEGWTITPILNINMSNTLSQRVNERQTVTLTDVNDSTYSITGDETRDKCIQCNAPLTVSGGSNIDVTYQTDYSSADVKTRNFYVFKDVNYADTESEATSHPESATVSMVLTGDSKKDFLPEFTLSPGKYIIQLSCVDDIQELSLSFPSEFESETVSLDPMYEDRAINRVYTLGVTGNDNAAVKLTVNGPQGARVIIKPIVSYTTLVVDNEWQGEEADALRDNVKLRLSELDPESRCAYATTGVVIKNPLDASSFHNSMHRYNSYTIDQWITSSAVADESTLQITTNVR